MATYLIKVDETYRCDTEFEATKLIKEAKENNDFSLSKFSSVKREIKSKGEVIDDWHRVTLTKIFTEEKDPDCEVKIKYSKEKFDYNEEEDEEIDYNNDELEDELTDNEKEDLEEFGSYDIGIEG